MAVDPMSAQSREPLPALEIAKALLQVQSDNVVVVGERSIHGENLIAMAAACIRVLVEQNRRASAGVDWQPIETAPKDGQEFLAWRGFRSFSGGSTETSKIIGEVCVRAWDHEPFKATHWQPLPAAPTLGGSDA